MPPHDLADRFDDLRVIGSGGQGTVYAGIDKQGGARRAIKSLNAAVDPAQVADLKAEFRNARGVRHGHVVRLYELHVDHHQAWFSMELVDGETLDVWAAGDAEDERVLLALSEVADGLAALHAAGVVHRDVKPENIRIDRDGHARIVDFGIAWRAPETAAGVGAQRPAGTLQFMPPEQLRGGVVGPAADVFALGRVLDVLWNGDPEAWPPEDQRAPNPGLQALVARMCATAPDERPGSAEVAAALRAMVPGQRVVSATVAPAAECVGRDAEVARLSRVAEEARVAGRPLLLDLVGEAGIGKSTLAKHLLGHLARQSPAMLLLVGRCRPEESVNFNALDELVEDLRRWLIDQPTLEFSTPHAAALLRVFPALAAVSGLAEAARADRSPQGDPTAQRARAFTALAALWSQIGRERPLALWIEDLHWADADSHQALLGVFGGPTPPPVLLVCTRRPGDDATTDFGLPTERVPLGALDPAASSELLARLCPGTAPLGRLVDAAGGHPLFLRIAAQAVAEKVETRLDTLEALLADRLRRLPGQIMEVVRLVCVASRPLALPSLVGLAGAAALDVLDDAVGSGMLRIASATEERSVEPFHERVRDAVRSLMSDDERATLHGRLADTLEEYGCADADQLALHWLASPTPDRARLWLERAAATAEASFAFDHAAGCYERLLPLLDEASDLCEHHKRHARALVSAGRGSEAAWAFARAAQLTSGEAQRQLHLASTEQLLASGHERDGIKALKRRFAEDGIFVPRQRLVLLLQIARMNGPRRRQMAVEPRALPEEASRVADTAFVGATGLLFGDMMLGAWLQSVHFVYGLCAADPLRVARALTTEAGFIATAGPAEVERAWTLLEGADERAELDDTPEMEAYRAVMRAAVHWSAFDWTEAERAGTAALERMVGHVYGRTFVHNFAWSLVLDAMYWRGDLARLRATVPDLLRDVDRRGDVYASTMIRGRFAAALQMHAGDPQGSLAFVADRAAPRPEFWLIDLIALHHRAEVALLAGDGEAVLNDLWARLSAIGWSGFLLSGPHRVKLLELAGRALVAAAARAGRVRRWYLLLWARLPIWGLQRAGTPFASLLAGVLRSGVAWVKRGAADPDALRALAADARRLDMHMHAAALDLRWAQATGSPVPEAAAAWLAANGVRHPDALARGLVPGL